MTPLMIFDIPPDPRGVGALVAVVLFIVGVIVLLLIGLVLFLWNRKRKLSRAEMIRTSAAPAQPRKPNQP